MERVTFLLEETGERVSALLNPETVALARRSGLRTLANRPGTITGAPTSDDPVVATGGGRTEITLDLLFDVAIAGSDPPVTDVRQLTGPLWALSENRARPFGPAGVRLVWGKAWNVPGVVEAVSERLERFDATGAPTRSWLRLRLLRTAEPPPGHLVPAPVDGLPAASATPRAPVVDLPGARYHEVVGTGGEGEADGERLDDLAARYLGDPGYWRHLAVLNGIEDPPWVRPGRVLVVPPVELLAPPPREEPAGGEAHSPAAPGAAPGPPQGEGT